MKYFVFLAFVATCLAEQPLGYSYQQPLGTLPSALPEAYGVAQFGGYQQAPQYYAPAPIDSYKKEFYSFAAPEEQFEDQHAAQKIAAAVQRNLRVVFIRAPQHKALEQAALTLAKQSSQDRTAIYVLNKQADIGDLAQRVNLVRDQNTHKPEVHFVKYRTPAEAAHAQQHIQSYYDAVQGSTHSSNEAVAPVLDFVSKQAPLHATEAAYSVAPTLPNYGAAAVELAGYYGGNALAGGYNYALNTADFARSLQSAADNQGGLLSAGNDLASYKESAVTKLNERFSSGGKFVFPTEAVPTSAYLPPFKRSL